MSGFKLIFHWWAHFVILTKLLLKLCVASLILYTVENKDVSPAYNYGLQWRPSDKSLI